MAETVTMPKLGFDMAEGTLVRWVKQEGEAVKKAREYTERTQNPTNICMEKTLEKGNRTVAKITYKKSSTERPGRWIFFGWAAE